MKPNLRKRVSELIVSGILSGGFTSSELDEICVAVDTGEYSFRGLGRVIRDITRRLANTHSDDAFSPMDERLSLRLADLAYAVVRRRRLARDEVLKLIQRVDPAMHSLLRRREGTLFDLLVHFFERASRSSAERLLNSLDADASELVSPKDEYFEAITRRREA